MSETLTNHEKYLAGLPLNDELAALARGEMPEQEPASAPVLQENSGGIAKLTRTDRIALKELRQSDGWGALQKLLKMIVQDCRESAILVSENNPDEKTVVGAWQDVTIVKRAYDVAGTRVDAEVKQLDGETKG